MNPVHQKTLSKTEETLKSILHKEALLIYRKTGKGHKTVISQKISTRLINN